MSSDTVAQSFTVRACRLAHLNKKGGDRMHCRRQEGLNLAVRARVASEFGLRSSKGARFHWGLAVPLQFPHFG